MSINRDLHSLESRHSYLPIPLNPVLPPLVSDFYGHTRVAAARDVAPDRSLTDATGDPSPQNSTGHLVWSSSNGTPHRNSMFFLNSASILLKLRDCDKPGNLIPNDAYNFAVLPLVPPSARGGERDIFQWSSGAQPTTSRNHITSLVSTVRVLV